MNDFVGIMGDLAKFVQSERNAAYEEAERQSLRYIKDWIREQRLDPSTVDNVPDLLDDFMAQLRGIAVKEIGDADLPTAEQVRGILKARGLSDPQ